MNNQLREDNSIINRPTSMSNPDELRYTSNIISNCRITFTREQ